MKNQDAIDMARRCREEIMSLRARLAEVEPKADAYDQLRAVIGMFPQPSVGYAEDLVWKLDQQIRDLQADEAKANERS